MILSESSAIGRPGRLANREVHVWLARLDEFDGCHAALAATLSREETARARRFVYSKDQDRFIRRRGLLRHLLGAHTGMAPCQLRFRHESSGKPALDLGRRSCSLEFNTSHSNGVAAYALANQTAVGIDVEQVRECPDWQAIVLEQFTLREQSLFFGLPPERQLLAFYRGWTRKEALLKGLGMGLIDGLRHVEAALPASEPASIRRRGSGVNLAAGWTLIDLDPVTVPGVVVALAARADRVMARSHLLQPTGETSHSHFAGSAGILAGNTSLFANQSARRQGCRRSQA